MQQTDSNLVLDIMRTEEQITNISSDRLVTMLALSFGLLTTALAGSTLRCALHGDAISGG